MQIKVNKFYHVFLIGCIAVPEIKEMSLLMFYVVKLWLRMLALSEKIGFYQQKGSQRSNNNVMVALSSHSSICSMFCLLISKHCTQIDK